jgi:hypothetical protein
MKTIRLILTLLVGLHASFLYAQTALQPGDIMFVAYQYNSPDSYAFVVLKELAPGTKIMFTDKAVVGTNPVSLCTNENEVEWTSPNTVVPVGTIVLIQNDPPNSPTSICNVGTATGALSGLAAAGDQILAYQPGAGNNLSFIAAVSSSGYEANCLTSVAECGGTNNNVTCLPPGLAGTQFAISFSGLLPFGFYSGPTTFQNVGDVIAALNNPANWTRGPQNQALPEPWAFNITTAGKKAIKTESFHIYPNPSNGDITVSVANLKNGVKVKISNILGAHILTSPLNSNIQKIRIAEPGIYFVQLVDESGRVQQTEKLIIK